MRCIVGYSAYSEPMPCGKFSACWSLIRAIGMVAKAAKAIQQNFNIVTNQSRSRFPGTWIGFAPIQEQGTGSLNAHYTGTIKTDLCGEQDLISFGEFYRCQHDGELEAVGGWERWFGGGRLWRKSDDFCLYHREFRGTEFSRRAHQRRAAVDGSGHFDLSTTDVAFASWRPFLPRSRGQSGGSRLDCRGRAAC